MGGYTGGGISAVGGYWACD